MDMNGKRCTSGMFFSRARLPGTFIAAHCKSWLLKVDTARELNAFDVNAFDEVMMSETMMSWIPCLWNCVHVMCRDSQVYHTSADNHVKLKLQQKKTTKKNAKAFCSLTFKYIKHKMADSTALTEASLSRMDPRGEPHNLTLPNDRLDVLFPLQYVLSFM